MKLNKSADLTFNVLLPLLLGTIIYFFVNFTFFNLNIRNYLPDALWAWSFISSMLIIWNRRLPVLWIIIIFLLAGIFEFSQYDKLVAGTGDLLDVAIYFLSFAIALLVNPHFRNNYLIKSTIKRVHE